MQVRRCPVCERIFVASRARCVVDDAALDAPTEAIRDLFLGQQIRDRYRIEGRIGRGGHGAVYLARQLSMERDVAIKVLKEEASENKELVRRFEREARIVAHLRHPNTVEVYDYGQTEDGRIYLVTELLHGKPLDEVLEAGPIGEALTLKILTAVCGSLTEAHEQNVVHRDLKPGNIFLADVAGETVVKVLDFGIAKLTEDASFTTGGDIFGTPAYIAPEQAKSDTIDGRTDLYSLGVVAYECLTGVRPFQSQTAMGLLMKHIKDPPPPFDEAVVVSPGLRELVFGMLAKLPDDRPPSARTVRDLIAPIVLSQSMPERTLVTRTLTPPPVTGPILWDDGRRSQWMLLVGFLAVALGLGLWFGLSDLPAETAHDATATAPDDATTVASAAPPTEAPEIVATEAPASAAMASEAPSSEPPRTAASVVPAERSDARTPATSAPERVVTTGLGTMEPAKPKTTKPNAGGRGRGRTPGLAAARPAAPTTAAPASEPAAPTTEGQREFKRRFEAPHGEATP